MTTATIAESAESLRLSNRALRVLRRANITTVDALAKLSDWEISDLQNVGPVVALEIAAARNRALGLALRTNDAPRTGEAAPPERLAGDFLTMDEAAAALGVNVRTISNMLDRGDLTRHRLGPRAVRILRSEVYSAIRPEVTR